MEAGLRENLLWLSDKVEEMQLVLFDTGTESNIPSEAEVRELAQIANDTGMAFTVHLPGAIEFGHDDVCARKSAELFRKTVARTRPLAPICWTFHAAISHAFDFRETTDAKYLATYAARTMEHLAALIPLFDTPRDLAIENVYSHFYIEPDFIREFDTSVCIDIGHLLLYGQDVDAHLDAWLPRCRNIHLHGVDACGCDHRSIAHISREHLSRILRRLSGEPALETVTIEVFGTKDFVSSLAVLRDLGYRR